MALLGRLIACVLALAFSLYAYIDLHNAVTRLRVDIPRLKRQVREWEERNTALSFQLSRYESPAFLTQRLQDPRFGHLHFPSEQDIESRGGEGE